MKIGLKNFCNGQGSTSTLDKHRPSIDALLGSDLADDGVSHPQTLPTLEEMILGLEIEEAIVRKSRLPVESHRRRSCVNSSDHILLSAKNALNQYPRFSLDGRDAMCRSSFGSFSPPIGEERSISNIHEPRRRRKKKRSRYSDLDMGKEKKPPPLTVGGEAVLWCKPGVVAKLMGLDALPVPLSQGRLSFATPITKSRRSPSPHQSKRAEKWDDTESRHRRLGRGDEIEAPAQVCGANVNSGLRPKFCVLKPHQFL